MFTGKIPPSSTLIFDIELMEIRNGPRSHESFRDMDLNDDWKLSRQEVCLFDSKQELSASLNIIDHFLTSFHRWSSTWRRNLRNMATHLMTHIMKWWLMTSSKTRMRTKMALYLLGNSPPYMMSFEWLIQLWIRCFIDWKSYIYCCLKQNLPSCNATCEHICKMFYAISLFCFSGWPSSFFTFCTCQTLFIFPLHTEINVIVHFC